MPLGRTIGISLALMAISVGAVAKTTHNKGAPGHHAKAAKSARSGRPAAHRHRHFAAHLTRRRPADDDGAAPAAEDAYVGPTHPVGAQQIGAAAWYEFKGRRTATGERMDGVTATAAHRSLPLDSMAKVTNLDNGRTVVVRINDRGPVSHRFIIDLSRPAAEELGMMRSGTAAVAVEPIEPGAVAADRTRPKLAAYQ